MSGSKLAGCALLLALLASGCRRTHGEPSPNAIDPRAEPLQEPLQPTDAREAAQWGDDDTVLEPKARYRIAARVLSAERYYFGWNAELSPLDLALGWGEMSDPSVDRWVEWRQGSRWYYWEWSADSPFRNDDIRVASANVHIVPATASLRRALLDIDEGDLIELRGFLVNITTRDEHYWN